MNNVSDNQNGKSDYLPFANYKQNEYMMIYWKKLCDRPIFVFYKVCIIYVNTLELTFAFKSKGKSDYFPLPITKRMKIWSYTAEDYVTGLLSW